MPPLINLYAWLRFWSQGTTNAIKIMLTEKTPSAALVEGVSNLSDIDRTCADEGNMNSVPYTLFAL